MSETYLTAVSVLHMDEYYTVDHWPEEGDKCTADFEKSTPGGAISNMATVLSCLGTNVKFYDVMSHSKTADSLLSDMNDHGIDTSCVRRIKGMKDSKCLIFHSGSERTIVWMHHPKKIPPLDDQTISLFENSAYIYSYLGTSVFIDTYNTLMGFKNKGAKLVFDVEACFGEEGQKLIEKCNIVFFNQFGLRANVEAMGIGEDGYLNHLLDSGVETIVMTKGSKGCRVVTHDDDFISPAFNVEVVDTNGAGDTFNASFLHRIMKGDSPKEAAKFANLAASVSVTMFGPRALAMPETDVLLLAKNIINK